MSKDIITIDHVQSGQAGPYKDSVWSAYICCRMDGVYTNGAKAYRRLKEEDVEALARLFVREFRKEPEWHEPKLVECRAVGPTKEMKEECGPKHVPDLASRWFVKIVQEYLD